MSDPNIEIAERIMGLKVDRERRKVYVQTGPDCGWLGPLPDYIVSSPVNNLLREKMEAEGFKLQVIPNPPDVQKWIGKTFTAIFSRSQEIFEDTQDSENLAVCRAALKAFGIEDPNPV